MQQNDTLEMVYVKKEKKLWAKLIILINQVDDFNNLFFYRQNYILLSILIVGKK